MTSEFSGEIDDLPRKDRWAFEALKELLLRERGFDLDAYKERCVIRRILLRARSRGHAGLGEYYRELLLEPAEVGNLFHYLTIHVTQFLRNPGAFRYLRSRILPHLTGTKTGDPSLRLWSAGCASGEEAYSLALLVHDLERERGAAVTHHVTATDVDEASLEKARRGVYAKETLRNLTPEEIAAYFTPLEDGTYRVGEELRKSVTFRHANILTDAPSKRQHVILCRNLLIYLSRVEQERVISRLAVALAPGGYLVLGKAESLIGRNRNFFATISPTERIYQKRDLPLEGEDAEAAL